MIKLNGHEYSIHEEYDKGVTIYKDQEKIKKINVYEYTGSMYMNGILVLIGHDDDVVMVNLETLRIKKGRFR